jgi:hypothetical protein
MIKHEDFGKYLHDKYPCVVQKDLYVECNEGWHDLIDELTKKINNYCDTISSKYGEKPLINVVHIKEKFGGLRYYVDYFIDREDITPVEFIIRNYEMKSYHICEDCGTTGDRCAPDGYWMKTLCEKCQEKYRMGDTPNGI